MNTLLRRSSLLALTAFAGSAFGQVEAYDGFDYPAGAPVIGQTGGAGFSTPWQTAGYGGWSGDCAGMTSLRVWQLMQGQHGSARSSSGGLQRSLATPIAGTTGSSVWISFIARHTGPTSSSWLGVKLPCSGPGSSPFIFLGKPFGQATWGVDNGTSGGARSILLPAVQKIRGVARIDFRDGPDDVTIWTDPALDAEPSLADASLHLPAYGNFADLRKVLIETGSTGGAVSNSIDELRIGSTYAEVTPVEAGVVLDGVRVKPAPGSTAIITGAGMGMGPHVRVLNTSGTLGCNASVELHSAEGGSVFIGADALSSAGGEIKIKHKGWDGLIYHRESMQQSSDGSLTLETDFDGFPVTAVRTVVRDGSGGVFHDDTNPGPVGHVVHVPGGVVVSGPCPDGSIPTWQYVTVFYNPPIYKNYDWVAFEKIWVFGCPGEHFPLNRSITVTGIVEPGTQIDTGLAELEVSSPNLPSLDIGQPAVALHGTEVSGMGDVVLSSACGDDTCDSSPPCTIPADRKVVVRNIGSSGQDGVEIKWPKASPPASGGVTLGDILDSGGEAEMSMKKNYVGHVTLMKQRVIGNGQGGGQVFPDYSELGSTEYRMLAYRDGLIVRDETLPAGTPVDIEAQIICGPGKQIVWGWVTMWVWNPWPVSGSWQTHWGVVGCMTIGTGNGNGNTFTDRVVFMPVNPQPSEDLGEVTIAARNTSEIVVETIGTPATTGCNADFNQDGFLDFFDYDDFVLAFETGVGNADFNGDGFTDFFDYDEFVLAFELGC